MKQLASDIQTQRQLVIDNLEAARRCVITHQANIDDVQQIIPMAPDNETLKQLGTCLATHVTQWEQAVALVAKYEESLLEI